MHIILTIMCFIQPDFTVGQDLKSPGVGAQFKNEVAHPSNYQIILANLLDCRLSDQISPPIVERVESRLNQPTSL